MIQETYMAHSFKYRIETEWLLNDRDSQVHCKKLVSRKRYKIKMLLLHTSNVICGLSISVISNELG